MLMALTRAHHHFAKQAASLICVNWPKIVKGRVKATMQKKLTAVLIMAFVVAIALASCTSSATMTTGTPAAAPFDAATMRMAPAMLDLAITLESHLPDEAALSHEVELLRTLVQ